MRKIFVCIAFFSVVLSACNDWLTIEPSDQISGEDLYANADGYYTQINGIYQDMAKSELYGCELSWGFLDVLAQYYDMSTSTNHGYKQAADGYNYGYARTKDIIAPIWSKMYNIIVNCNDLIQHIPAADTSFFPRRQMEKDMILGEAYGLRAILHFDLLRLFAPAPVTGDTKRYIPYVDQFPTLVPVKITNEEVLNKVIADLRRAHDLTFVHDSIYREGLRDVKYRFELETGKYPRFTSHRGYRLNHYAIKAMLARVYHYKGDRDSALYYAEQVIQLHEYEGYFAYNESADIKESEKKNVKLYGDVLFALYNNKLMDYSNAVNSDESNYLCLLDYDGIFNGEAEKDLRALQWKENKNSKWIPVKISAQPEASSQGQFCNKLIPMIRMSEMYYIVAEHEFQTYKQKAWYHLSYVRMARGLGWSEEANTQEDFNKQILNDMRRELYGEGQLFFFYKRLNMKVLKKGLNVVTLGEKFVLPIPESNDVNR
jgi:hypothetical protein